MSLRVSRVALVRCSSYDPSEVRDAVGRAIELLGGDGTLVRPGDTVLLKPNLLAGTEPSAAVTTHPSVFRAAANLVIDAGGKPIYGDSPGYGPLIKVARAARISPVAEELGVPCADVSDVVEVAYPEGRVLKKFTLFRAAAESSGVFSLAKLKTHGLTYLTGAVKNLFGCIPGTRKAEYHLRMGDRETFSKMLVDLYGCLKPALSIIDAVVGMEGNGPRSGNPKPVGAIIAGFDGIAVDSVAAALVGIDPLSVPTVKYGEEFGLGVGDPRGIEVVGDSLEDLRVRDFRPSVGAPERGTVPPWVTRIARKSIVPWPTIDPAKCTRCRTCVEVCPARPKALSAGKGEVPQYDYDLCIRCYCCQELCPEGAISLKTGFLGRLLVRG
ncbi:MAG: DUF362 domain-containing protein [bacterium]